MISSNALVRRPAGRVLGLPVLPLQRRHLQIEILAIRVQEQTNQSSQRSKSSRIGIVNIGNLLPVLRHQPD